MFLLIAYGLTAGIASLFLLPFYWLNIEDNNDFIFYWSLIVMICYSVPSEFGVPVLDALCLLVLSSDQKKYGQIRSFTAMSWGAFHVAIGVLLEYDVIKLHHSVYLYVVCNVPLLVSTYFAFHRIESTSNDLTDIKLTERKSSDDDDDYGSMTRGNDESSDSKISQYLQTLKFIFSRSYTIGLFLIGFVFGGGWVTVQSLLFLYVSDLANSSNSEETAYLLMGVSVGISVIFEIPFMYSSEWFVERMGFRNMIFVGFICYVLRLTGYSLLSADNLWLLLVIETLQGFTMGLVHVAIVTLCATIFPQHLAVSAQGLMSSIRFGFAPFLFLIASGYIMEYVGGQWLYRGLAFAVFLTLIAFYFLSADLNRVILQKQNIEISKQTKIRTMSVASECL